MSKPKKQKQKAPPQKSGPNHLKHLTNQSRTDAVGAVAHQPYATLAYRMAGVNTKRNHTFILTRPNDTKHELMATAFASAHIANPADLLTAELSFAPREGREVQPYQVMAVLKDYEHKVRTLTVEQQNIVDEKIAAMTAEALDLETGYRGDSNA